jgi:hypothetical protein
MGVFKRLIDRIEETLAGLRDYEMLGDDQKWRAVLYVARFYQPIPDVPEGETFVELFQEWYDAMIEEDL